MKILFVSAEVSPLAKVGGLGDVSSALPKHLFYLGQDVRIVMPKYEMIDLRFSHTLIAKNIPVQIGKDRQYINIYQTFLPKTEVIIYLIENKKYLSQGEIYQHKGEFGEIQRFLFFSKATLEVPWATKFYPEIFHIQDWHTALIPLFLKLDRRYVKKPKVLFTIHNLAMQGRWNWQETMEFLGLKESDYPTLSEAFYGPFGRDFNSIQQGILVSDFINTVSPSYAREILTKIYFSRGLMKYFQKRKESFCGILNGVDYNNFNPLTDPDIPYHYSINSFSGKKKNKLYLKRKLDIKTDENRPLFGVVSRLTFQKGIDLILQTVPLIIQEGDIVILGQGEEGIEQSLKKVARKYQKNIRVFIKFDASLARKIYAASDFFLMPSKFEPCGLGQLIAMRYGACPVVRRVGGLRDTVRPLKFEKSFLAKKVRGNGLIFTEYDPNKFWKAINYGLNLFRKKRIWRKVVVQLMKQNFSWEKSAKKYENLYKKIVD